MLDGNPGQFQIDTVKYDYVKNTNAFDAVIDNNTYFYQSSKVTDEFALDNGVFEWGNYPHKIYSLGILK